MRFWATHRKLSLNLLILIHGGLIDSIIFQHIIWTSHLNDWCSLWDLCHVQLSSFFLVVLIQLGCVYVLAFSLIACTDSIVKTYSSCLPVRLQNLLYEIGFVFAGIPVLWRAFTKVTWNCTIAPQFQGILLCECKPAIIRPAHLDAISSIRTKCENTLLIPISGLVLYSYRGWKMVLPYLYVVNTHNSVVLEIRYCTYNKLWMCLLCVWL